MYACGMRAAMLSLALFCMVPGLAMTVLTKSDMRLWETVTDRSAPLAWPWADAADSATLVFSNRLTRMVSSVTIPRAANEARGACPHLLPQAGEAIVDVTLVQMDGVNEVVRETATLACVSGAGGGPITVRTKGTRAWDRVMEPCVYAFDPAWQGDSGDSGYDIAWPMCRPLKIILR
jgi:hypothetical protein